LIPSVTATFAMFIRILAIGMELAEGFADEDIDKPQAASRKPQAASRKPQAASRKPQAASRKPQAAL